MIDFTYDSYKDLLRLIGDSGYEFANYHNNDSIEKPCILRHDIDSDLEAAYKMATLEHSLGISSTYFVLLRTNFYNVFSKQSSVTLDEISKLGHEIGLHFDETQILNDQINAEDFASEIVKDAELLSKAIGRTISTVSFHRPSKEKLDANYCIEGIENSYSKKYFKEYKYLSDSRMEWREDVAGIISSKEYKKIHVLVHPFWYSNEKESMKEKLALLIKNGAYARYDTLSVNFRDLGSVLDRNDILK